MPSFIVSIEVATQAESETFTSHAMKNKWSQRIESSKGIRYKLPTNTFIGTFKDIEEAHLSFLVSLHAAEKEHRNKILLEKFILAEFSQTKFDSNEKKKVSKVAAPGRAPARIPAEGPRFAQRR